MLEGDRLKKNMGMKCSCGALAQPKKIKIEGFGVRAWKCPKCKEEYIDSGDAEFVLMMKKMQKKAVTAKIGVLGDSFIVRIPKEIAEMLKLTRGSKAVLSLNAPNNLVISVCE
jgi:hypothetical protein